MSFIRKVTLVVATGFMCLTTAFSGQAIALPAPQPTSGVSVSTATWARPGTQYTIFAGGDWYTCSVGYPMTDAQGNHYFVTAGHCFRSDSGLHYTMGNNQGLNIYNPNSTVPAGWERAYTKMNQNGTFYDASLVELYKDKSLTAKGWSNIPNTPINAKVGDSVCFVGYREDGRICGHVTKTDIPVRYYGYTYDAIVDQMDACDRSGDSGGAVFNNQGAVGIISAGTDTCNRSASSEFVPIIPIMEAFKKVVPTLRMA